MQFDPFVFISTAASVGSCIAAIAAVITALFIHQDSKRPEVVIYLEHDRDHSCMSLFVANYGSGVARNVTISGFDESMVSEGLRDKAMGGFLSNGIPALVPGASRSTVIQFGGDMNKFADKETNVLVSYDAPRFCFGTKQYSESFVLDYGSFSNTLYTDSDLHRIMIALEKISKDKG